MIFCGMGGGALVAGIAASFMLPRWGWQSVLYLGGALPIVLAAVLIVALPESVRFLIARGTDRRRVADLARRMGMSDPDGAQTRRGPPRRARTDAPGGAWAIARLFTEGRSPGRCSSGCRSS